MSCPYQHGSAPQAICGSIETITGLNVSPEWHAADDSIDETLDMWDGTSPDTMTEKERENRRLTKASTEEALDAAADFFESEGIDPNSPYAEVMLNGAIASGKLKMTRGNAANLSTMRRTLNRRRERIADGTARTDFNEGNLREYQVNVRYSSNQITSPDNVVVVGDIRAYSEDEALQYALNDLGDPENVYSAQVVDITPPNPCSPEGLDDDQWYTRASRAEAERDIGPGYAILRTTDPDGSSLTLATRMVEVNPDGATRWEYTAVRTDWEGNEEVYTMADFRTPPALRGGGAGETVRALHSFLIDHAEASEGGEAARSFPWSQDMSDDLARLVNEHRMSDFSGGYGTV